ncbi:MAG: LamG-like jellyroll fold domain-containing protein, partial [Bacteroidota bacterium]|nr:LamG-like jellyroll fold domain-containing protein [Bacteroidota bacterium]MDP3143819.1 LamG-like jellyroll fold domain-containing protein [Bacteroidota bacterium]
MRKLFFSFFSLLILLVQSQTLSTSLTACYALNGNGIEPINNLTGTLSAVTPTVDRFSNPNSALHFNGTPGSFVSLPNSALLKSTNAVSFSGWVKLDNIIQNQYIVFAHNTCASFHEGYTLVAQNLGTGFRLYGVKSGPACSGATQHVLASSSTLNANTWYHIGGYFGNDSIKIYLNGALAGSMPSTVTLNYNATDNVYLGGSGLAFNLPLIGTIDNARFYNRKLTNGEFNQLFLTDPACVASVSNPNCNNSFYALSGSSVFESSIGIPNTSTLTGLPLPPGATGLAIGPAFGFPASNPTYWTTAGGTYWYYNGTNFVNTTHSTGNAGAVNPGGSKNFIYNLVGATGQVYKYNGTGPATLVATIPALAAGGPYDLVGDDQDNFYYLRAQTPQSLNVYNPLGVLTCSYSLTGIVPAALGGGFGIVGNTVTAHTGAAYYVGTITGSVVNFTTAPSSFASPSDFANCYLVTTFSSTINANPSASLTCSNPTVTLTASSTLSPLTYTWTGPGILTPINNQSVQVNVAGVYTCSLTATNECPVKTSICTYTVLNGSSLLTPTISSTGSLSCTNPTTQLSVAPNSVTNTILWNGPGIVGANNTPTINVNAPGIYSVTLTSTICSGTATFNLQSGIGPLTLTPNPLSAQICSSSGPVTLSVTGAANYTWSPASSLIPSTGSIVVANPSITTTYTINGTTGVCSGSALVTVSVNATPTIIISGSAPICAGASATLSASGASTYTWNPGNLVGSTVIVTPATTTNYTVIGSNGSCTASAVTLVTVISNPTITALGSPASICQGASSSLLAAGAVSYTWQPGNLNGALITVTPAISTIYTVSGTNASGCVASNTLLITVNPNPTITINPASPTVCIGSSTTLTANGAINYTWTPGGNTTATIAISPTIATTYTVNGDNGFCSSTATVLVNVSPSPTITPSTSNTLICNGSSATLSVVGASTYTWNPGNLNGTPIIVSPTTT